MMTGWLQCFASRVCAFSSAWRRKHTPLEGLQVAQGRLHGDICMHHMSVGMGVLLCGIERECMLAEVRLKSPHEDLYNPPSSKASRDEFLSKVE